MKTREIDAELSQQFEELPTPIKEMMASQVCLNCEKPLDDKKIMYVLSPRGFVRWWHYIDAYEDWKGVPRCDKKISTP